MSTDWLVQATSIQAEFDQWLWSDAAGGYYNTASDASDSLLIRERSYQDSTTPAANGVAIVNLLQLALLTENLTYLDHAERTLKSFSVIMEQATRACPTLFQGLDWYRHQTLIQTSLDRANELLPQYLPTGVISAQTDLPEHTVGLVCQGFTCQKPAKTYDQLIEQIVASQQRA